MIDCVSDDCLINIKVVNEIDTIHYLVPSFITISALKKMIKTQIHFQDYQDSNDFKIMFNNQVLLDETKTLNDYDIKDYSVLIIKFDIIKLLVINQHEQYEYYVSNSLTVKDFKNLIDKSNHFKNKCYQLYHNDNIMIDAYKLEDYYLYDNDIIEYNTDLFQLSVLCECYTSFKKMFCIFVKRDECLKNIKLLIFDKTKIPLSIQYFSYYCKLLVVDQIKLDDIFPLSNMAIIHLYKRVIFDD